MKKAIVFVIIFFITSCAFAETIKLKIDEVVEGKIIERTDEEVVVDIGNGIFAAFLWEDVESVDGKKVDNMGNYIVIPEGHKLFQLNTGKIYIGRVISQSKAKIRIETDKGMVLIPRKMLATEEDREKIRESAKRRAARKREARRRKKQAAARATIKQREQGAEGGNSRAFLDEDKEQGIQFLAVSMYDGMGGGSYGFNQKVFNRIQAQAGQVRLDLRKVLYQRCVYRQEDDTFFVVFYNRVQAVGCDRQYLIQRVFLNNKESGGSSGIASKRKYLVAVEKIDEAGTAEMADEYYILSSLDSATKRFADVTVEVGCGEIPGVVEGEEWPFGSAVSNKIQAYQSHPGLYDKINFDFSNTFKFTFEFGEYGRPQVNVPGYTCREY